MIEPRHLFFVLIKLRCFSCQEDFDGDQMQFTIRDNHVYCAECAPAGAVGVAQPQG
ncbi:MAG TPA: hypothetical protein VLT79_03725 [Gemmatimonadales bacterium]|nr:hypothetical protein [Gemmatimonadales bacterium]